MTFLVKLHKTNKMPKSKIKGLGFYVPENIVTNHDLTKIMDTSDEWIKERTGIETRSHIVKGDGDSTAVMAFKASKIAIERAKIMPSDIELILFVLFNLNLNI